jgi:hypothetical protein
MMWCKPGFTFSVLIHEKASLWTIRQSKSANGSPADKEINLFAKAFPKGVLPLVKSPSVMICRCRYARNSS